MAAELKIGIGADITNFLKGLDGVEKSLKDFEKKFDGLVAIGDRVSSIGQKMSVGLTLPILALGGSAIKAYGDLQSLEMGLKAVMGSAGLASGELEKLREVAKLPGLGLKEAVRGSVALQAAGFSADDARRSLMAFGNALATVGKGANELGFVNLALTQIQNKTSGFGQDLRQLTEQLPQLRGAMETAFGTSNSEDIAKLGYTGKEVVAMLTTEFEKLPKVTGGINNAFENLRDNIFVNMSRIGKIIDDTFDISGIIDKLTGYLDTAISYFEGLSPAVQKTILVVTGLVAAAGPLLVVIGGLIAMGPQLLLLFNGIKVAMLAITGPIGLVTIGIIGIVAAVVSNWGKIKPYIIDTINYFRNLYNESIIVRIAVAGIATMFKNTFAIVANILKTAWEIFKTFAKGTADLFAGIGTVIKGALTGDLGAIKGGLAQMSSAWSSGIASLSQDVGNGIKALYNDIGGNLFDGWAMITDSKKLQPITDLKIFDKKKIADKVADDLTDGVKEGVKKVKPIEVDASELVAFDTSKFNESFDKIYKETLSYQTMLRDLYYGTAEQITNSIPGITNAMNAVQASVMENIVSLRDEFAKMADFGNFVGDAIVTSFNFVVDTIADSFSAIGEAMASGGNIFSAVGNAVLANIGAFLGDLGKQMIQYGVAALAYSILTKALLNPLTAAPSAVAMIAAGAALSLISGAIKGTLSKGGASSGGGSVPSGGGNASQSYSSSFSGGGSGGEGRVVFEISGDKLLGVLDRARDRNTRLGG